MTICVVNPFKVVNIEHNQGLSPIPVFTDKPQIQFSELLSIWKSGQFICILYRNDTLIIIDENSC